MNRFAVSLAAFVGLMFFCGIVANGADKGEVSVKMSARKVVRDAKGAERFESGEQAKPGDVIEYVAVYRNTGKEKVTGLLATIPVPREMEFLPGTARPDRFDASVDGKAFGPAPLKRRVKLPNGKEELREVPPEEYRALRWEFESLEAGATVKAAARMRIRNGTSDTK